MVTPHQNSPELLRAEILAQARRASEGIGRRAQREAEALLAKAAGDAELLRQEIIQKARAEAARRTELILAAVPVETGRLRSARINALLQSVWEETLRQLVTREGFDYREALVALAAEAVSQMAGQDFVIKISPADQVVWGELLGAEISRRLGRATLQLSIVAEPAINAGGVMIQDEEGRQLWDNQFGVRLARLWPELRRKIAVQTSLVASSNPAGGGA